MVLAGDGEKGIKPTRILLVVDSLSQPTQTSVIRQVNYGMRRTAKHCSKSCYSHSTHGTDMSMMCLSRDARVWSRGPQVAHGIEKARKLNANAAVCQLVVGCGEATDIKVLPSKSSKVSLGVDLTEREKRSIIKKWMAKLGKGNMSEEQVPKP